VILPKENEKDVENLDLPTSIMREIAIVYVEHMDQVLGAALETEDPEAILAAGRGEVRTVEDILGIPPPAALPSAHATEAQQIQ